jgi:hypothetical protein
MPADNRLYITDAAGVAQSFVTLPRRQRLGVPADLIEQTAALTAETDRFLASLSMGVTQLSDGNYLLVHVDTDYVQAATQVEYSNTTYWASIVSADLSRACVDEPIRFPSVDLARVVFSGDTVLLLARTVHDDGSVRATQRRYTVSSEGCAWTALEAPVALTGNTPAR